MRSFYKAVPIYIQKKLPADDLLLRALTSLNLRQWKYQDTFQNYEVVAKEVLSTGSEEEIITGDEWVRYHKMDLKQGKIELKLTILVQNILLMSVLIMLKFCLKW